MGAEEESSSISQIRQAVLYDDMDNVEILLAAGVKPDSPSMICAAGSKQAGMLAMLLSAGGDPNADAPGTFGREKPLHVAIFSSYSAEDKVSVLLEAGANPDSSAVFNATKFASAEILAKLLSAGGDPNAELDEELALDIAIDANDLMKVTLLVDAGAKPTSYSMINAAETAQAEILAKLLSAGGDPNARPHNNTLLDAAILADDLAKVSALLEAGAKPDSNSMISAADSAQVGILAKLLSAGGDPNASDCYGLDRSPLTQAVCRSDMEKVSLLLQFGANPSPSAMTEAARDSDPSILSKLLDAGGDPNRNVVGNMPSGSADYHGPLHCAAYRGNAETLALLLKAGADPNLEIGGTFALHWACLSKKAEVVELLIEAGADPNARCIADYPYAQGRQYLFYKEGDAPIDLLGSNSSVDVLDVLLKAGVDPNTSDVSGQSALHRAALKGGDAFVARLLQAGVDPNQPRSDGEAPLHVAASEGHYHSDVVEALLAAGADPNKAAVKDGATPLHRAAAATGTSKYLLSVLIAGGANVLLEDNEKNRPSSYTEREEILTFLLTAEAHKRQQLLEARLPTVNEWAPPKRQGNDGPCMVIGDKVWNPKEEAQAQSSAAVQEAPRQRMRL